MTSSEIIFLFMSIPLSVALMCFGALMYLEAVDPIDFYVDWLKVDGVQEYSPEDTQLSRVPRHQEQA